MKLLLVNGIYDEHTYQTLKNVDVTAFGFDLRAKSKNLIPFSQLNQILKSIPSHEVFLHFENDLEATVLSFLNLLEVHKRQFHLLFRDARSPEYYERLNKNFYWMFQPDADWRSILECRNIKGIFLPLKWQNHYQNIPFLWEMIENKKLDIFIHADHFSEIQKCESLAGLRLSVDLSFEIENSYRSVDQMRLKNLELWRKKNETFVI